MEEHKIVGKGFFVACVVGLVLLLYIFFRSYFFANTRIVFCDVGQGDGAYIRTKEKIDIVIDAGPGSEMAHCLGKYMPFYDREIELAFLSHPQKDHYGGYSSIVSHYTINRFITIPIDNDNKSFNELKKELLAKHTPIINLYRGDNVIISNNSAIRFVWPTKAFLASNILHKNNNAHNNVLGAYTTSIDLNGFSETFFYSEGNFDILFTGDADSKLLAAISTDPLLLGKVSTNGGTNVKNNCGENQCLSYPNKLEILKVPHHGSKNGLSLDFLKLADPTLSVISVAKKNQYGHPSKQILDMYQALKKQVVQTKDEGDIKIIVHDDGSWQRE